MGSRQPKRKRVKFQKWLHKNMNVKKCINTGMIKNKLVTSEELINSTEVSEQTQTTTKPPPLPSPLLENAPLRTTSYDGWLQHMAENETCAICLEALSLPDFGALIVLPCKHVLHQSCAQRLPVTSTPSPCTCCSGDIHNHNHAITCHRKTVKLEQRCPLCRSVVQICSSPHTTTTGENHHNSNSTSTTADSENNSHNTGNSTIPTHRSNRPPTTTPPTTLTFPSSLLATRSTSSSTLSMSYRMARSMPSSIVHQRHRNGAGIVNNTRSQQQQRITRVSLLQDTSENSISTRFSAEATDQQKQLPLHYNSNDFGITKTRHLPTKSQQQQQQQNNSKRGSSVDYDSIFIDWSCEHWNNFLDYLADRTMKACGISHL